MLEQYIICILVLIMNTAVLWYVIGKRLDEIQVDYRTEFTLLFDSLEEAKSDINMTNQNILKLDENVIEL
jgi:hypothetical protein